jgi:hypothetical protein
VSLRENFDEFEEHAKIRSGLEIYQISRKKVRSVRLTRGDGDAENVEFTRRDHFKTQVRTIFEN